MLTSCLLPSPQGGAAATSSARTLNVQWPHVQPASRSRAGALLPTRLSVQQCGLLFRIRFFASSRIQMRRASLQTVAYYRASAPKAAPATRPDCTCALLHESYGPIAASESRAADRCPTGNMFPASLPHTEPPHNPPAPRTHPLGCVSSTRCIRSLREDPAGRQPPVHQIRIRAQTACLDAT